MFQIVPNYERVPVKTGTQNEIIKHVIDVLLPLSFEEDHSLAAKAFFEDNPRETWAKHYNDPEWAWDVCGDVCNAQVVNIDLPKKMWGLLEDRESIVMTAWTRDECYLWYIQKILVPYMEANPEHDVYEDLCVRDLQELKDCCKGRDAPESLKDWMYDGSTEHKVIEIPAPK